jgi:hypothetical protein
VLAGPAAASLAAAGIASLQGEKKDESKSAMQLLQRERLESCRHFGRLCIMHSPSI